MTSSAPPSPPLDTVPGEPVGSDAPTVDVTANVTDDTAPSDTTGETIDDEADDAEEQARVTAELQAAIARLQTELDGHRASIAASIDKSRRIDARDALQDALRARVRPEFVAVLMKAHAPSIEFDADGDAVVLLGTGRPLPIETAVIAWARSANARPYLA